MCGRDLLQVHPRSLFVLGCSLTYISSSWWELFCAVWLRSCSLDRKGWVLMQGHARFRGSVTLSPSELMKEKCKVNIQNPEGKGGHAPPPPPPHHAASHSRDRYHINKECCLSRKAIFTELESHGKQPGWDMLSRKY